MISFTYSVKSVNFGLLKLVIFSKDGTTKFVTVKLRLY